MDVVKTELDQLGGTISVNTEKGKGTIFTLSLPMTFALMETLSIMSQHNQYMIPIKAIIGTEIFDKKFNPVIQIIFYREQLLDIISKKVKLKRGQVIILDEAHMSAGARHWN